VLLHIRDDLPGIGLVPMAVELFRNSAQLDDEVARKVPRLGLASLLAPKAQQSRLVAAHNDPGVRAADELPPIGVGLHLNSGHKTSFIW
jgi:hypothetical protein